MDKIQLASFLNYMLGWKNLGVDRNGEEVSEPICPEMRAFLVSRFGDATPVHGYGAVRRADERKLLSDFFRLVADSLDVLT